MLRNFRAYQLAKETYSACKAIKVAPFLRDQLMRASASVALNIAEGSGKRTPQDQRRFYSIALGSLRECEAILSLEEIKNPSLHRSMAQLGAILYTLTRNKTASVKTQNRGCTETETETETAESPIPF
jgi:four helix bundle protein